MLNRRDERPATVLEGVLWAVAIALAVWLVLFAVIRWGFA